MRSNKKLLYVFVLSSLISMNILLAQSRTPIIYYSDNPDSIKEIILAPQYDIFIAAGFSAGGRVGFRYLFVDNFSFEISYGYDIRNFIGAGESQIKYSLGFNYHLENCDAAFSLLTKYVEKLNKDYDAILFTPTFGFIPIRNSGLQTFFRFGIYIEYIKTFPDEKWKVEDFGPNLDVGISFIF